jgi:hypothetical protein
MVKRVPVVDFETKLGHCTLANAGKQSESWILRPQIQIEIRTEPGMRIADGKWTAVSSSNFTLFDGIGGTNRPGALVLPQMDLLA